MASGSWLRRGAFVLGAVAATGAALGGVQLRRSARSAAIERSAESAIDALVTQCRWERPVVGGPARDCNGAQEEATAVQHLFASTRSGEIVDARLLDAVEHDASAPPAAAELLAAHAGELAALRDATRCSWACVRDPAPLSSFRHGTWRDAAALLLLAAHAGDARTCTTMALDALRLLEDMASGVAGVFLYELPTQRRLVREVRRALVACVARSDAATSRAAAEDATLLAAPAPVGDAMALGALESAATFVEDAHGNRPSAETLWVQRGVLLDAAEDAVSRVPTLRAYRDDDLPAAFDRLRRELPPPRHVIFGAHDPGTGNPSTDAILELEGRPAEILHAHALFDRDLRLAAVSVAAIRDRLAAGAWPDHGPAELSLASLRDPFSGAPFAWSVTDAVATLVAPAVPDVEAEAVALAVGYPAAP